MGEERYWKRQSSGTLYRRRFLAAIGAGSAGLAALSCAAHPSKAPSGASTTSQGSPSGAVKPQTGGTYTAYVQYNPPLDPHKVSAGAQTVVGGVLSRVFRFKTAADPQVIANHDVENDLGVSAESPDAISYFNSDSTSNQEHLKDPTLDTMLAKERTQVDTGERLKAVVEIEKYIAQKMYCVPTVGSYRFVFVQSRVQNYQYSNSLAVSTETFSKVWLQG